MFQSTSVYFEEANFLSLSLIRPAKVRIVNTSTQQSSHLEDRCQGAQRQCNLNSSQFLLCTGPISFLSQFAIAVPPFRLFKVSPSLAQSGPQRL